ncbi:MAG TPA: hypothetical protein VFE47_29855 [Tepidisphaeraceae bacterium]|jgi:hypothetical protein|nr:hypothetical protein [Tepidisphaeraceae bacterium]
MAQPISAQDNSFAVEVEKILRLTDASSMAGSLGRLLKGFALALAVGLVFATVLWFFLLIYDLRSLNWLGWFIVYLVPIIAACVWYDQMTRRAYVSDAAAANISEPPPAPPALEFGKVPAILLWAPRSIVDGYRGFRGLRTMEQHASFSRAAILVVDLSKNEGGVEVKRLVRPPEDMKVFAMSVEMLEAFSLIGKASDGKSMWLNSTFRQKLRPLMPAR